MKKIQPYTTAAFPLKSTKHFLSTKHFFMSLSFCASFIGSSFAMDPNEYRSYGNSHYGQSPSYFTQKPYEGGGSFNHDLQQAKYGDAVAQYHIARAYLLGFGVPRDKSLALYWCQKSAQQGIGYAQHMLNNQFNEFYEEDWLENLDRSDNYLPVSKPKETNSHTSHPNPTVIQKSLTNDEKDKLQGLLLNATRKANELLKSLELIEGKNRNQNNFYNNLIELQKIRDLIIKSQQALDDQENPPIQPQMNQQKQPQNNQVTHIDDLSQKISKIEVTPKKQNNSNNSSHSKHLVNGVKSNGPPSGSKNLKFYGKK